MLNITPGNITGKLAGGGRLAACGLIPDNAGGNFNAGRNLWRLHQALAETRRPSVEKILRNMLGATTRSFLKWDDFEHLGETRELLADMLKGALREGAEGVNILFYGPPGTGKTEFCKVLARRLKAEFYQVGEADDADGEPNRTERICCLKIAQRLIAVNGNGVILFDEMEDLLPDGSSRLSKVYINRLLEKAPAPTLWTTNNIGSFDPALLRRMTLAVEMRTPPVSVREKVWRRNLAQHRVRLPDADIKALARDAEAAPAIAANAARVSRLAEGGANHLRLAVQSLTKAVRRGRELLPANDAPAPFDSRLISSNLDLSRLEDRLARPGAALNFSLCLSGPPGTGKSAFARRLAGRMGLEVLQKRASDLFNMFVGGTEANIAKAFAEARQQKAFLIFDEADSFLANRSGAFRNWEISQVNEMLTWMENHPLPFACTTNLMEALDPASLRRFTFKPRFDYLGPTQAIQAFAIFFGLPAPPELAGLAGLTPGDFAVVRRNAEIMGEIDNPDRLVVLLRDECEAKPGIPRRIGFC